MASVALSQQGQATKSDQEDKIKLFYSLYDTDDKGFLKREDFITMLMNYPIEYIDNVTDGFFKEAIGIKKLNAESIAQMSNEPDSHIQDNSVSNHPGRNDPILRVRRGSVQLEVTNQKKQPKLQREMSVELDANRVDLNVSVNSNKSDRSFAAYAGMAKLKRKGSQDSIQAYQIECTTINNRIKQYVAGLFVEFDALDTGKLDLVQFKSWIKEHLMILKHFEDNFHVDIWRASDKDPSVLNFKLFPPEVNFYANFTCKVSHAVNERVWVQLHKKFLVVLRKKEDTVPRRVVLVDGLTLTKEESPGKETFIFTLSHKSSQYKTVRLELDDSHSFEKIIKKLSYLQE